MTIRGTLMLAGVLALLCTYLFLTAPPVEPVGDLARRLAPPLARASVVEIDDRGQIVRAERAGGAWSIDAVADLLTTLASIDVLTVIDPDPANPETFGFGDALRLRVLDGTDLLLSLEVGAANPARTGVYVRREGQPAVLLVGALLRWELEKIRRAPSTTATP
jgi:hypothetical protein